MSAAPDFDRLADSYDRLRPVDGNWWEVFDAIVAAGDLRGSRVLDVGCGTGRFAHALADSGVRVWGVDPSARMLEWARAHPLPGGGLKHGRAERLPFKDGWFDAAVLRQVVHLVERPRAFGELARVLRAGGRLVIATFDPADFDGFWVSALFPSVAAIDRARFPSARELALELRHAGFSEPDVRGLVQAGRLTRDDALERIRGRYISTLHLLDEEEFEEGLARAERELPATVAYRVAWIVVTAGRPASPTRRPEA